MDLTGPAAEGDPEALQHAHPEGDISFDDQTNVWGAAIQLNATGKRYIAGPTLAELTAKLNAEGRASA
jgi:hypothetical protein